VAQYHKVLRLWHAFDLVIWADNDSQGRETESTDSRVNELLEAWHRLSKDAPQYVTRTAEMKSALAKPQAYQFDLLDHAQCRSGLPW
jgi:hypothetical protein